MINTMSSKSYTWAWFVSSKRPHRYISYDDAIIAKLESNLGTHKKEVIPPLGAPFLKSSPPCFNSLIELTHSFR